MLVRPALQVVLYNWLKARTVGCPALAVPLYVRVRVMLDSVDAIELLLMSPAVLEMRVTVVPAPAARKPVWPSQRVMALRRFVAVAVASAPIWKLSPVLLLVLAVNCTRREPARPMVTVWPLVGLLLKLPLHCSCAVPL